jgi:molybdate transport system ATP-binding protein
MLDIEITHRLGTFELDVAFRSGPGLTALFGPSGAGKTSVINIIAGLVRPQRARVAVDDAVLVDTDRRVFVPKHKRRIGYVFQEARLFPHLSVRHNLLFGRWFASRAGRRESRERIISLLGIEHLLDRRPSRLSGGEKQRVAIGRALLASPRLLLMDEPLASLDAQRKDEILPYVERLRDETRIPIIYVSHSLDEVARLATTMVLMSGGRVDAVGSVTEILSRLDLQAHTDSFEAGAVLETTVAGHDRRFGLTNLACAAGEITVPILDLAEGAAVRVRIRARDVIVAVSRPSGLSALNVLAGRVAEIGADGASMRDIRIELPGGSLLARLTNRSLSELGLAPGRHVFAIIKSIAIDRHSIGTGGGVRPREDFDL